MARKSMYYTKKELLEHANHNGLAYYTNTVENLGRDHDQDGRIAFGQLLKQAIDQSGLKQKNIADKAGVHATSLSRILSGDLKIKPETAENLVRSINALAGKPLVNAHVAMSKLNRMLGNDELFTDEIFTMFYSLEEPFRSIARKQIRAILEALSDTIEPIDPSKHLVQLELDDEEI